MTAGDLRLAVHGIGVLGAFGRGTAALRAALESGAGAPTTDDSGRCAYRVDIPSPEQVAVRRRLRRADRLSRIATVAALDAMADAGIADPAEAGFGTIVGTGFGPQATTFAFLDDLLDFGDLAASPTSFSHSVHNAAASYIATVLGLAGPTVTVSEFGFSFHTALSIAATWIGEGRCEYVLVGGAEAGGAVMEQICARLPGAAGETGIRPFAFSPDPLTVPGEGAAFFVVSAASGDAACRMDVGWEAALDEGREPTVRLLDADGLSTDETPYRAAAASGVPCASYTPLFGGTFAGSALHAAVAVMALREGRLWPSPVQDNPHGVPLASPDAVGRPERVECVRYDCAGDVAKIVAALAGDPANRAREEPVDE